MCISDGRTESSNFDSLIPITVALDNLAIFLNSSILGYKLLTLRWLKWSHIHGGVFSKISWQNVTTYLFICHWNGSKRNLFPRPMEIQIYWILALYECLTLVKSTHRLVETIWNQILNGWPQDFNVWFKNY